MLNLNSIVSWETTLAFSIFSRAAIASGNPRRNSASATVTSTSRNWIFPPNLFRSTTAVPCGPPCRVFISNSPIRYKSPLASKPFGPVLWRSIQWYTPQRFCLLGRRCRLYHHKLSEPTPENVTHASISRVIQAYSALLLSALVHPKNTSEAKSQRKSTPLHPIECDRQIDQKLELVPS